MTLPRRKIKFHFNVVFSWRWLYSLQRSICLFEKESPAGIQIAMRVKRSGKNAQGFIHLCLLRAEIASVFHHGRFLYSFLGWILGSQAYMASTLKAKPSLMSHMSQMSFHHIWSPTAISIQAECLVTAVISIFRLHGLTCSISIQANGLVTLGSYALCKLFAALSCKPRVMWRYKPPMRMRKTTFKRQTSLLLAPLLTTLLSDRPVHPPFPPLLSVNNTPKVAFVVYRVLHSHAQEYHQSS